MLTHDLGTLNPGYHEMEPGDRVRVPFADGYYMEITLSEGDGIQVSAQPGYLVIKPETANKITIESTDH